MATILVVDDEPALRDLLAELLGDEGHTVLTAADGAAAAEILGRAAPDLVVTDAMMPRLDGPGLLRWMRTQPALRGVPAVVVSAVGRVDPDGLGAVAFVAKPFELAALLAAVDAALGTGARTRPSSEEGAGSWGGRLEPEDGRDPGADRSPAGRRSSAPTDDPRQAGGPRVKVWVPRGASRYRTEDDRDRKGVAAARRFSRRPGRRAAAGR